eukprot:TRINITY_DN265_c1_g2_i1.p1 TRINITY_DN265_c1_g2~~TRINITY_DN265_c1_g2_i1.p1  ORF type:complete len:257 (+),score=30.06 TRINITY_DN265_c1_g2_i1:46-816(+)
MSLKRKRIAFMLIVLLTLVIGAILSDMMEEEGVSMIEEIIINPKRAGGFEYEVLGLQALKDVHANGLNHRGVWIYVTDQNGYMLVVWRPPHMRTCAAAWCIVGEHSLPRESWTDTAKRGMREELGWSRDQVLSLSAVGTLYFNHTYANGKKDRQLCTIFHVVVKGGKHRPPIRPNNEIGKSRWIRPRELVKEIINSTDDSTYCDTYTKGMVFGHGLIAVCKHMKCDLSDRIPYLTNIAPHNNPWQRNNNYLLRTTI